MKTIVIDGKIIECEKYYVLDEVTKDILKNLPAKECELVKKIKDTSQATLSRKLNELAWQGIVHYIKLNGREKKWVLEDD